MDSDRHSWLAYVLSDLNLRLCALFTLVFVVMPPEGVGFEMCSSKRLTGAPCPGCGITRCGANLVRGEVTRAAQYHPMGVVLLPILAALGVLGLMPRRWRERVRERLLPWARMGRPVFWVVTGGFVLYGAIRWGLVVGGVLTWP